MKTACSVTKTDTFTYDFQSAEFQKLWFLCIQIVHVEEQ